MTVWRPIKTAPRDGTVIQTYWYDILPVYAAWFPGYPESKEVRRKWLFWKETVITDSGLKAGFCVLIATREGRLARHGNFNSFMPKWWAPVLPWPKK